MRQHHRQERLAERRVTGCRADTPGTPHPALLEALLRSTLRLGAWWRYFGDVDLFHISTRVAWEAACAAGEYRAPSLATEGFVHLSEERQWPGTLRRFFAGQSGLVLLVIDSAKLRAAVKYEEVDRDRFPHLYGALNLDAVVEVRPL